MTSRKITRSKTGFTAGGEAFSIQYKMTLALVRSFAEQQFNRLQEFEKESKESAFTMASLRYSRALWSLIVETTPEGLLTRLNDLTPAEVRQPNDPAARHDITAARLQYLLRRTVFILGVRYDEAHSAEWYRAFAFEIYCADQLNDMAVFKAIAAGKQKRRLKAPDFGRLKYHLLVAWLAGGLWKLQTYEARRARLRQLVNPHCVDATAESLRKAQRRLRL